MKVESKPWAVGDTCPNLCGDLRPVPSATAAMRARAADKDANAWQPVPPTHDSAAEEFIAEHGTLFACDRCGYKTRADVPAAEPEAEAAAPASKGRKAAAASTGA